MTRQLPVVQNNGLNTRAELEIRTGLDAVRMELRTFAGDGAYRGEVQQHSTSLDDEEVRDDDPQWRPGDADPLQCDSDTGRTINVRRTRVPLLDGLEASFAPDPEAPKRPLVRSACLPRRVEALRYIGFTDDDIGRMYEARGSLPCPFASCQHNLRIGEGLSVDSIFVPRPDIPSWLLLPATCAIDEAERFDRDGVQPTLEVVAAFLGVTRERVRQIEHRGVLALAAEFRVSVEWMLHVLSEPEGRALAHDTAVLRRRQQQTATWNASRRTVQKKRNERQKEKSAAKVRRDAVRASRA